MQPQQRDAFTKYDSQYQQQPQWSWVGGSREPSPEAAGGEKLQEEVQRLRTTLAKERRAREEQSIRLQELHWERQNFREELFRVKTELESLLEAKEQLLNAKEGEYAALRDRLNQGGSRGRSPSHILSASSSTWDGEAGATNYHDEQLRQVVAERNELKARVKRHEDWQDHIMKTVNEVECTHSQTLQEKKELQRELEHMHQELQRTRLERDVTRSSQGCEGNSSWRMSSSVRDGWDGSGRESSRDARGRDSGWDGSLCDGGERGGHDGRDRAGVNRRDQSLCKLRSDASARDHIWDESGRDGGHDGSSRFKKAPITGCTPGSHSTSEAYIVEDPDTPAPLVRSKSSWINFNQ